MSRAVSMLPAHDKCSVHFSYSLSSFYLVYAFFQVFESEMVTVWLVLFEKDLRLFFNTLCE